MKKQNSLQLHKQVDAKEASEHEQAKAEGEKAKAKARDRLS